jgi:transcription initiation factor TFIIIB Brf1 subunit/transcription initiation factor TFIIB
VSRTRISPKLRGHCSDGADERLAAKPGLKFNAYIFGNTDCWCAFVKAQERIYNLSKSLESLSKEEHGLFFDAMQRLGLPNEVKQAAVALYLDFKSRPIGEYNADHKNLEIFLIASISLAAKAMGDLRTDHEFESKMFVSREKLVDAEERIIRSFGVQDSIMPFPELVLQLAKRQIESMAEGFAERELVSGNEKEDLVRRSHGYLDAAVEKGLAPKMSYRGRAAGVMLKAVRDLGLEISEMDIARAAGFDKRSMAINANVIDSVLKDSKGSKGKRDSD